VKIAGQEGRVPLLAENVFEVASDFEELIEGKGPVPCLVE
jgi:hypothetical protein